MAKERTSAWRPPALTGPRLRPALRDLAVQHWLLRAHARLEIQSALASRMRDYAGQLEDRITERQAWIQEQLSSPGHSRESTQPYRKQRSMVSGIIDELAREGRTLSPQVLNAALMEHGESPLPITVAQGHINDYLLTKN